jgi:fibronectin type 3 domain-containing protein
MIALNSLPTLRNRWHRILCILAIALQAVTSHAELIPGSRKNDWTPGVSVGVIGGIPVRTKLVDVTKPPYNADNTGATDAKPAIQAAIDAAVAEDVVYLPAGTYRINTPLRLPWSKSNITVRGAGPGLTRIDSHSPEGVFGAGQDFINEDWPTPITKSHSKGDTVISIPKIGWTLEAKGMPNRGVGSVVLFSVLNNTDPNNLVVSVAGFERMRNFMAVITAVTDETITIAHPLPFDLPVELEPQASYDFHFLSRVGLEDIHIDAANSTSPFQVGFSQSISCWFKNVKVTNTRNYLLALGSSINCEVRECDLRTRVGTGTNGAGLIMGRAYNCLIEDNIIMDIFPHMEINASCTGNVFAYNFCEGNDVFGVMGASIDSNHGPHNSYNLYEGNVSSKFQCDGYFGGASEDTLFRNWFHGTSETTDMTGQCIVLNRFTRNYNIVGNILGRDNPKPGLQFPTYLYENKNDGTGGQDGNYDGHGSQRYIYVLGTPNIGNGGYQPYEPPLSPNRFAQPSAGKWWAKWNGTRMIRKGQFQAGTAYVVGDVVDLYADGGPGTLGSCLQWQAKNPAKSGTSTWTTPGPGSLDWSPLSANSFQELDLDVPGTLIRKGNFNYATRSIPENESIGGEVMPKSLYRGDVKPAWFGDRPWPPFDPVAPGAPTYDRIPAGYRYMHGKNPPGIVSDDEAPSAPGTLTTSLTGAVQVKLSWGASTDNLGALAYHVERSQGSGATTFTQIGTAATPSFSDSGLTASTVYNYRVRAFDAAGNLSPYSAVATVTTSVGSDIVAPTAPANVSAVVTGPTQIDLSWAASTDAVGVTGYQVERSQGSGATTFAQIGTPGLPSFSDTGLTASTVYNYRVRAIDAAGNLSVYSPVNTVSTPAPPSDMVEPTVPTNLAMAVAEVAAQITLTWSAAADNVGVTGYRIERSQGSGSTEFAQVAVATATTHTDTTLAAATVYNFRILAVDAAGNVSGYSSVITGTTPPPAEDKAPPTAPSSLIAEPAGGGQMNLAWGPASDNVAVIGYRVERLNDTVFVPVATSGTTTYADKQLTSTTTYKYRVAAVDAAGNTSDYSNVAEATTTSGPKKPSNLRVKGPK